MFDINPGLIIWTIIVFVVEVDPVFFDQSDFFSHSTNNH